MVWVCVDSPTIKHTQTVREKSERWDSERLAAARVCRRTAKPNCPSTDTVLHSCCCLTCCACKPEPVQAYSLCVCLHAPTALPPCSPWLSHSPHTRLKHSFTAAAARSTACSSTRASLPAQLTRHHSASLPPSLAPHTPHDTPSLTCSTPAQVEGGTGTGTERQQACRNAESRGSPLDC